MTGHDLYLLYCDQLRRHGLNVLSAAAPSLKDLPTAPALASYHALPPRVKAFWQTLAQQIEDRQRPPHGTLNLRTGRFTP